MRRRHEVLEERVRGAARDGEDGEAALYGGAVRVLQAATLQPAVRFIRPCGQPRALFFQRVPCLKAKFKEGKLELSAELPDKNAESLLRLSRLL